MFKHCKIQKSIILIIQDFLKIFESAAGERMSGCGGAPGGAEFNTTLPVTLNYLGDWSSFTLSLIIETQTLRRTSKMRL